MSQEWFIRRETEEDGPHSSSVLRKLVKAGSLAIDDEIRRSDRAEWVRAGNVRGLFAPAATQVAPASEGHLPPPLPNRSPTSTPSSPPAYTAASPPHLPKADSAAAVATLYRDSFDARLAGDPAVLRSESITPKKREALATYAGLGGNENILFAIDTTIFGVATEGLTFTDRALAWSFPDGNRGRLTYVKIAAHSVHLDARPGSPQRLCFAAGTTKHSLPCKSLPYISATAVAEFLASAARVAQGLRPDEALPRARDLVAAGDSIAAVTLWEGLLNDDVLQFPAILADVANARSQRPQDATLSRFHDTLTQRAADHQSGWLVPRIGDHPLQLSAGDLLARWRSGEVRCESKVRHVSDAHWTTAGRVVPLNAQRVVYVSDTGTFDEDQFLACSKALAAEGLGFDELLVFGPTTAKIEDAAGKPILHVGLTAAELILAWGPSGSSPVVERSPVISIVWKYSDSHGSRQLEIATAKRSTTFRLPPGAGTNHFLEVASDLFLRAAEDSLAQERRTEASRLLDRVVATDANREQLDQLRSRARADEEVLCVYEGGHPDHVDACLGTLRLDPDGFEFMSIAPESQVFFRVPYERVVDFPAPQRGALPADIQKSLLGPNSLLSAGLGVAAACVIPGGALLVRSLSTSMGPDRTAGPPINRLTAVTSLSGTAYKIFFDVVGETAAEMSQKAKTFWSRTARMKSKFYKPGTVAQPTRPADTADAEVKALLREIRDSLQLILKVVSLDLAATRRRQAGVLAAAQLEALRKSLGAQLAGRLGLPAEQPPLPPAAIVIACPKCSVRIRAGKPGVIRCAACGSLARLGPDLFAPRPFHHASVAANGIN